jgi:hypothetical protein
MTRSLFFSDSHNYPVGDDENEEPLVWVFDEVRKFAVFLTL